MGGTWQRFLAVALLLGAFLLLAGCGGGGGVSGVSQTSFTVAGKTTLNGAGLPGVSVTLSGVATPLTTDANGRFSADLANGSYTITPSLAGYTFYPASQTMTVSGGSLSVPEFTASALATSHTVSGRVVLSGGAGLAGVQVTLSGAGTGSAVTDAGGNYSFPGVPSGGCIVAPALSGYVFNPMSQAISVGSSDYTVPDITATALPTSFTISGQVTLNGTGLAGVTVILTGAGSGSATTSANGTFAFPGARNGSYTLTPTITGYSFNPTSLTLTVNNASLAGQDFAAVPPAGGSITITF